MKSRFLLLACFVATVCGSMALSALAAKPAKSPQDAKADEAKAPAGPPLIAVADDPAGSPLAHPLSHQILHEAFLATVRDEFGAITYDATLREAVPDVAAQKAEVWEVLSNIDPSRAPFELTLNRVEQDAKKQVLRRKLTTEGISAEQIEKIVIRSEQLMHHAFIEALKKDGLKPKPHTWHDSAAVGGEVDDLLVNFSLPAQFVAVRRIHSQINDDGESPERLAALARAYANLGMLTEHFWTTSTKALTARGLIYAERLNAKQPDAATSLDDLTAGDELAKKTNETQPPWVALAEAYCKFEPKKLTDGVEDRYVPLARWLYLLAIEPSQDSQFLGAAVDAVLEKTPDAYHAIDSMAGQWNWNHRVQGSEYGVTSASQYIISTRV